MTLGLINANPVVHAKKERVARTEDLHADDAVDPLDIYVNKQLNDKERVAAALENPNLRQLVDECLYSNEL